MSLTRIHQAGPVRRGLKVTAAWVAIAAAGAGLPGCSHEGKVEPVDAARARDALRTALDGWKQGSKPAALKDASPPIVIQDADWDDGAKLLAYLVEDEGRPVDANLVVPVTLTLRNKQGKETKRSVSYLVATDPSLMIFRGVR